MRLQRMFQSTRLNLPYENVTAGRSACGKRSIGRKRCRPCNRIPIAFYHFRRLKQTDRFKRLRVMKPNALHSRDGNRFSVGRKRHVSEQIVVFLIDARGGRILLRGDNAR